MQQLSKNKFNSLFWPKIEVKTKQLILHQHLNAKPRCLSSKKTQYNCKSIKVFWYILVEQVSLAATWWQHFYAADVMAGANGWKNCRKKMSRRQEEEDSSSLRQIFDAFQGKKFLIPPPDLIIVPSFSSAKLLLFNLITKPGCFFYCCKNAKFLVTCWNDTQGNVCHMHEILWSWDHFIWWYLSHQLSLSAAAVTASGLRSQISNKTAEI